MVIQEPTAKSSFSQLKKESSFPVVETLLPTILLIISRTSATISHHLNNARHAQVTQQNSCQGFATNSTTVPLYVFFLSLF